MRNLINSEIDINVHHSHGVVKRDIFSQTYKLG